MHTNTNTNKYHQSLNHNHNHNHNNNNLVIPPPLLLLPYNQKKQRHTSHSHSNSKTNNSILSPSITQHTKSSDFNHQPHGFIDHINPYHPNRDTTDNIENKSNGNGNGNNGKSQGKFAEIKSENTRKSNLSSPLSSTLTSSDNNEEEVSHKEILSILYNNAFPSTLDLKKRSLAAIGLMISSKMVVVSIPFWYKSIIDSMNNIDVNSMPMTIPIFLILGYGTSRALSSIFRESQSAIFSHVTMSGTKKMASKMFKHLHSLDLEFHLNRQTGILSKAIDRGVRAITYICNTTLINVVPTIFEVALVCGILGYTFEDKSFLLCTTTTVGLYVLWSVAVTQYRTGIIYIYIKNK